MKKRILIIILIFSSSIYSQDFLMQGWYWDYPKTINGFNWADTLTDKAQELAEAGFTYVWLPPLSRASFGSGSNGYDPQDLYDLGEVYGGGATGFGTRNNVNQLVTEFNNVGINAVADVVYNHRDGGKAEDNTAVKDYVTTYSDWKVDNGYNPFPYDRFRCILPIGGSSGNGVGDYYFKVSSISAHSNFNNYEYNIYMQTNTVGWQNLTDDVESEPNGGGDCGQVNNDIRLGVNMNAVNEEFNGCRTDEFHLSLTSDDFDASGDTLYIYFNNRNSGYSDMRIYGIWSGPRSDDIVDELIYQTYTDFTNMPSGQGQMNYLNFKPNGVNNTKLDGFWDWPWFFYDYDQNINSTQTVLYDWTKWLIEGIGINGLRMDAVKHFPPSFVAGLFDFLSTNSVDVPFNVGEFYDSDLDQLKSWIDSVYANMSTSSINPRLFDFHLRDALKNASDSYGYDVRNVFTSGMVNGKNISPFNVVTFMNNHDTRDSSHVVLNDPILGYAYILTNNQIGMPTVFYPDYYTMPDYKPFPSYDLPGMKEEIDALMAVHKKYIYGAASVDYLSGKNTIYNQNFVSGLDETTLFYQISETSSGRDLLVAINYAGEELDVDHGINGSNVDAGSVFIDLIGNSSEEYTKVNSSLSLNITVPSRSYSIWIEGVTIQAKIFLEGAYNSSTNLMSTSLNDNNKLPFTSPFSEDLRTVTSIDETITDWILVQLYDELTNEPVVSKSVFVKEDGMICLEDGSTAIPLDAGDGDYYLVLKHRNHLAVASKSKISVSATSELYDFTSSDN